MVLLVLCFFFGGDISSIFFLSGAAFYVTCYLVDIDHIFVFAPSTVEHVKNIN